MNRKIEQTYDIKAPPEDVWRALTDAKEIAEWSGANAYFIPQEGARYTLWNGDIVGKVLKVQAPSLLSQTWEPTSWTRTDSVVTFMLGRSKEGTKVVLLHENVEDADYDGTSEGWDIYYLGAIKKKLEARTKEARNAKGAKGTKAAKGSAKKAKGAKASRKSSAKGAKKAKSAVKKKSRK